MQQLKTRSAHIIQRRIWAADVKKDMQKLLGWSPYLDQYESYQYKKAIAYLLLILPSWPSVRKELEASPIFWNWWKNQWATRDQILLDEAPYTNQFETVAFLFKQMHNAATLVEYLQPSYAEMIGIVMKKAAR